MSQMNAPKVLSAGHATLSSGSVVVSTVLATSTACIFVSIDGGTQTNAAAVRVSTRSAGVSFTITSADGADVSVVAYSITEPF